MAECTSEAWNIEYNCVVAYYSFMRNISISRRHRRGFDAEFGGREKNWRTKFSNDLFKGKISILTSKISDDFFSHWPYFVYLLSVSTVNLILCNNIYHRFLAKKPYLRTKHFFMTPFFSQFVLCHASNNTNSRNTKETNAWAVPHLKFFWGTVPPVSLSLRPW